MLVAVDQSTRTLKPYPVLLLEDFDHARVHLTCFLHNRKLAILEVYREPSPRLLRDRAPAQPDSPQRARPSASHRWRAAPPALPARFTEFHGAMSAHPTRRATVVRSCRLRYRRRCRFLPRIAGCSALASFLRCRKSRLRAWSAPLLPPDASSPDALRAVVAGDEIAPADTATPFEQGGAHVPTFNLREASHHLVQGRGYSSTLITDC